MENPNPLAGRPSGPIDPPESHGPVATLDRACRSEAEAREGRRARADLDRFIIDLCKGGTILLSKDTPLAFGGAALVGRFVVAESTPDNPADISWVALWQDAHSGRLYHAIGHGAFACALDDIARRHRAGRLAFIPGYQR